VTNKKLPIESSTNWDEILEQVEIKTVPLAYVKSIIVTFVDGNTWELDIVKEKLEEDDTEDILDSIVDEYDDEIDTIEFRLNMEKVKEVIQESTDRFLSKKNK
jgi:hypothetical protein